MHDELRKKRMGESMSSTSATLPIGNCRSKERSRSLSKGPKQIGRSKSMGKFKNKIMC